MSWSCDKKLLLGADVLDLDWNFLTKKKIIPITIYLERLKREKKRKEDEWNKKDILSFPSFGNVIGKTKWI